MITIKLRRCTSERNRLTKSFVTDADITLQGTFKNPQDVLKPIIEIETSTNLSNYNYCEITEFGRSYFMTVTVNQTGLWTLALTVDVLSTYASGIKASSALVKRTFKNGKNNYFINDGIFFTEQREVVTYHLFKTGGVPATLGTESYYLMVAGG